MRQTLFTIPYDFGGVPLFGAGVLLALWLIASLVLLVRLVRQHGWGGEVWGYLPVLAIVSVALLYLPRLFPGGMPIRGYGVMMLLGAVVGVALAVHRGRQMGISDDVILSLAYWMFLAGIVGARLFHVIEYWDLSYRQETWFATFLEVINIPRGGLVVYGSLIGALSAFLVFARKHCLPALALADLIAPSMAFGLALGRIGCLLNGCCFGGTCEQAWAVQFPAGSPPYMRDMAKGRLPSEVVFLDRDDDRDGGKGGGVEVKGVTAGSPAAAAGLAKGQRVVGVGDQRIFSAADAYRALADQAVSGAPLQIVVNAGPMTAGSTTSDQVIALAGLPIPLTSQKVHPTQIYSAINALLIGSFLWLYYPFRRRDGEVIGWMLTIYPVTRFLLESIRKDEVAMFGTGFKISQLVSFAILAGVIGLWCYVLSRPRGLAWQQS